MDRRPRKRYTLVHAVGFHQEIGQPMRGFITALGLLFIIGGIWYIYNPPTFVVILEKPLPKMVSSLWDYFPLNLLTKILSTPAVSWSFPLILIGGLLCFGASTYIEPRPQITLASGVHLSPEEAYQHVKKLHAVVTQRILVFSLVWASASLIVGGAILIFVHQFVVRFSLGYLFEFSKPFSGILWLSMANMGALMVIAGALLYGGISLVAPSIVRDVTNFNYFEKM